MINKYAIQLKDLLPSETWRSKKGEFKTEGHIIGFVDDLVTLGIVQDRAANQKHWITQLDKILVGNVMQRGTESPEEMLNATIEGLRIIRNTMAEENERYSKEKLNGKDNNKAK